MGPNNLALVIPFATEASPNWPPVDSTQRDFAIRIRLAGTMSVKTMLLSAGAVLLLTAYAQQPSPPLLVAALLRPDARRAKPGSHRSCECSTHQKLGRCELTAPRLTRPHNATAPTKSFWSKIINMTRTRQLSA